MDSGKALAIFFAIIISVSIIGLGTAYRTSGGSGPVPETACNDGSDNDDDGLVDGDDPGCTEPFYADDSEANIYDLDASWIFSGKSAPDNSGPSAFYGWNVEFTDGTQLPDNKVGGDTINEWYIEGSNDTWGGGEELESEITIADAGTTDAINSDEGTSFWELIDLPGQNTGNTCGDGIQQSGETGQNCPQDVHLPESSSVVTLFEDGSLLRCESWDDGGGDDYGDDTENTILVSDSKAETSVPDYVPGNSYSELGNEFDIVSVFCSYPDSAWEVAGTIDYQYKSKSETYYDVSDSTTSCSTDYDTADSCDVSGQSCETNNPKQAYTEGTKSDSWTVSTPLLEGTYIGSGGSFSYYLSGGSTDKSYSGSHEHWEQDGSTYDFGYSCTSTSDGCSSGVNETCSSETIEDDKVLKDGTAVTDVSSYTATYYYKTPVESNSILVDNVNSKPGYTDEIEDSISIIDSRSDSSVKTAPGGYSYGGGDDSREGSNDMSASWTEMVAWGYPGSNAIRLHYNDWQVLDADGPDGQGSGYMAIDGGSIAGSTNGFLQSDIGDFVTQSDVPIPDCPGDSTKCVASVDPYTAVDGWDKTSYDGNAERFDFVKGNPYNLDASMGTCMMYKELTGDTSVTCERDNNGSSTDGPSPTPGGTRACGDQPYEYWAYMEGPEVDESVMENYPAHYEGCIDTSKADITRSACILHGDEVPEGYVANVAPEYSNAQYEEGGNQPDWEVCLDLEGTGIRNEGDEVPGDNVNNDLSQQDNGGEWYDLDSEMAQDYLRGSGSGLVGDTGPTGNYREVNHYWRDNPNPSHPRHNPEGESEGTAIEDDCGNDRYSENNNLRCNDASDRTSFSQTREPTFYSFFQNSYRDEDFHPQGDQPSPGSPGDFEGYINKLKDRSNQLEPGMDTTTYGMEDSGSSVPDYITRWNTSDGGQNQADQWAITPTMNWSISSRGTPYPPYGTYAHPEGSVRSSKESDSIPKYYKVFGNSYAAIANTSLTDAKGETVSPGEGVWIDPDSLKEGYTSGDYRLPPGSGSWRDEVSFRMDLTGPDAGLGWDTGDSSSLTIRSSEGVSSSVVFGDIFYEGEPSSTDPTADNTAGELEPPMCGDDRKEFLLEEMGESSKPEQFTGLYGCASVRTYCVDRSSSENFFERTTPGDPNDYHQTDEWDEEVGRLKNDKEFCGQTEDDLSVWYDQDFGDVDMDGVQETCRVNDLYGNEGVRWFEEGYVKDHPLAVQGGVDDDWNGYIEQHLSIYPDKYDRLDPRPNKDSWIGSDFNTQTPVSSGSPNESVASMGFCGGDDGGEFLTTMECNTRYCDTDRSVQGVAKVPGSCVFDEQSTQYETDLPDESSREHRQLFQPGEKITITDVQGSPEIACFNGAWFSEWPVNFHRDSMEVPLGSEDRVAFDVINVRESEVTFEIEMRDPGGLSAYRFSSFVEKEGDSFTTTVPPSSSKTFHVEISGGHEDLDSDLTLAADAVGIEQFGTDSVSVQVVEGSSGTGGEVKQTQDVPGIQWLQVVFLLVVSTFIYIRSMNNL